MMIIMQRYDGKRFINNYYLLPIERSECTWIWISLRGAILVPKRSKLLLPKKESQQVSQDLLPSVFNASISQVELLKISKRRKEQKEESYEKRVKPNVTAVMGASESRSLKMEDGTY